MRLVARLCDRASFEQNPWGCEGARREADDSGSCLGESGGDPKTPTRAFLGTGRKPRFESVHNLREPLCKGGGNCVTPLTVPDDEDFHFFHGVQNCSGVHRVALREGRTYPSGASEDFIAKA